LRHRPRAARATRSLPTRRSSDLLADRRYQLLLGAMLLGDVVEHLQHAALPGVRHLLAGEEDVADVTVLRAQAQLQLAELAARPRSEEHTSELQSRENLVCRLLLE